LPRECLCPATPATLCFVKIEILQARRSSWHARARGAKTSTKGPTRSPSGRFPRPSGRWRAFGRPAACSSPTPPGGLSEPSWVAGRLMILTESPLVNFDGLLARLLGPQRRRVSGRAVFPDMEPRLRSPIGAESLPPFREGPGIAPCAGGFYAGLLGSVRTRPPPRGKRCGMLRGLAAHAGSDEHGGRKVIALRHMAPRPGSRALPPTLSLHHENHRRGQHRAGPELESQ